MASPSRRPARPQAPPPISNAGGPFPIDQKRAEADAKATLARIDWSRRDIYIWVPGTDGHEMHPGFEAAVRRGAGASPVVITKLDYEAGWNMRPSVATGIATMKLVLAGIAAHGGNHKVMIAGESQGAWVIGEALADPLLGKVITRAVLMGHPSAGLHHYDDGHDPRVFELNHVDDLVAYEAKGDKAAALDGMLALRTGQWGKVPQYLGALFENLGVVGPLLKSTVANLPFLKDVFIDPHNYSMEMQRIADFLRTGVRGGATDAATGARLAMAAL